MLVSLTVKQFALIEHVQLELHAGMTVFTGETGAGKSMLVGALGAVFGARASSEWVRHGAEKADVTAVWQGDDQRISSLLEEHDIDVEDALILRRVVSKDGRSRAYLNGVPVALKMLRQIGEICLDFHGQHEHQSLMQADVQMQVVDAALSASADNNIFNDVAVAFKGWKQLQKQLLSLRAERGDTEQQAAWMREELARIEALQVEPGLADALQMQVDGGRHHAQVQQAASESVMLLDDAEPCVRGMLARASQALGPVEAFHHDLSASRELIDQMDALLGEVVPALRSVMDQSFDASELQACEERLMALHESMRRHSCDELGLLSLIEDWQQQLARLDTAGWDEASLLQALEAAALHYRSVAGTLTEQRTSIATDICLQLRPFLDRLALAGMQVRFDVAAQQDEHKWHASGWDEITMKVMSNPGEPWRDLTAVASGGEVSRLVLALKGGGALNDMPNVAVFDEVDTGIGGETAWCVGELLASMGRERQVLVISHLPQVASCADHQVVIGKNEKDGRTLTELKPVLAADRQHEIARMLGGADENGLQHAEAFLQRGQSMFAS
ncbi:DNA repair protein RecN [Mariprofundus sp. EBB-1]|uniref:DNA repair protein RecN n=1 Tax=Mariprofundus sp. EBB-1 TaxID=2650971 RepID=UPI000EF1E60F|nr:DNA repair protein RecN [Mariprofundus sp. EBB-1]RLL51094.1 DNA repair protein RecN [Mariprofundus sp. EBB-1]